MSSSISHKHMKLLLQRSGDRCAFPDCRKLLSVSSNDLDDAVILGEMAHISGEKAGSKTGNNASARYDVKMTDDERNSYKNLIYLCREHHRIIDEQENTYSVDRLLKMKNEHELWVQESLTQAMPQINFDQLEEITKHLLANVPNIPETQYTLIPPEEKIQRNGLTERSREYIKHGMLSSNAVYQFIQTKSIVDSDFAERLKAGFLEKYFFCIRSGYKNDDLFEEIQIFSAGNSRDFKRQAAGIAVLVYLFEACEIFER